MTLYRFIGKEEYNKLMNGETVYNNTDWSEYADTNSKGFCFMASTFKNVNKVLTYKLDDLGMSGCVSTDYFIVVKVDKARKAWGWYSGGKQAEYNLFQYSLKNVSAIYTFEKDFSNEAFENDVTYKSTKIF